MSTITFVTGNANKLKEVVAILAGSDGETKVGKFSISNKKLDLDELQGTIDEVITRKCEQAARIVGGPVMCEDTCLCFKAMHELPGPYIKWFVKYVGLEGINKMLDGFDDRSAQAVTTFGYCEGPGHKVRLFQGRTDGRIVSERGPTDFGWDAIFEPDGFQTTYAEMTGPEKNKISHRYKALSKLRDFLLAQ
ncbi:nucleoside triphosphate pyrophosphohydrolase ham1 [Brettanomyces nanus]|uniref:Inosine triphosphate pyrophosphatase n=1 Tax=Eeniella nana TaxID=13502 RepID=A0A875S6D7_EENNA|nr:nucleoside triphosphate pyrophosphohydrolase ham1 [Brettanomyces nanus]QPG75562.1 nucleoside triphosphate pyrophosphohydrolase ham1 [Brettanomyces nanus]